MLKPVTRCNRPQHHHEENTGDIEANVSCPSCQRTDAVFTVVRPSRRIASAAHDHIDDAKMTCENSLNHIENELAFAAQTVQRANQALTPQTTKTCRMLPRWQSMRSAARYDIHQERGNNALLLGIAA